ncbi:glycoside hydrolase family 15 protein [Actinoplanes sp. CA-030573]|uniref:glycoside hydrolase family 15 protein n=1 Tax=Actinoplanes sp. CA-030573 TaxID=3239898 RepID=UPI003D921BF5
MDLAVRDAAGYADLRSYAAIGDTRTVALIAGDGSIDWLPLPDLHSVPVFARLLDGPGGGSFELCPRSAHRVRREYEHGTNVLVTTYTTATGTVRVTDALTVGVTGPLPWSELVRLVEGVTGTVDMAWRVAPGTGLDTVSPWVHDTGHGAVLRMDAVTMALRTAGAGPVEYDDRAASGRFTTGAGSRHVLALVSSQGEPLRLPEVRRSEENVEHTRRQWRRWSGQFTYDGPWRDEALRSMLALKLLAYGPSGAIAAAATTSLPESAAGGKNWDYRFAWLRDSTYALHCMLAFGDFEDVHASVSWLLRTARARHAKLPVLARLDGAQPDGVARHDVPGWRGIGPVVSGNPAAEQLQLGVYGDLFDLVHTYVGAGNVLDLESARFLASAADRVCDIWHRPDAGMWELPEYRHYTSSKMACWQALDHAVDLAADGHIPGTPDRWRRERDRIAAWVHEHCWNAERRAYTWYPGTRALDTSVLLHARRGGFDAGDRMRATVDAVLEELSAGPLIYRYSGADKEEKTFTACAFWTVTALASLGRRAEAEQRMGELLPLANDVGLYTEMIDAEDHSFWGNAPQALSHLAVTTAITALAGTE